MKTLVAILSLLVAGGLASHQPLAGVQEIDDPYLKWIRQDVLYIITPEEADVFGKLSSDQERGSFIEQFWRRRDPTPQTAGNEYREEHYRRIAYANEAFTSGFPGWKTDRGMIYVKFGPPDRLERSPTGGDYQRPAWEGGGSTTTYPFEVWEYRHLGGVGDDIEIEFVDDSLSGEYRIAGSPHDKDALLYVPNAGLTEAEMIGLVEQKIDRIVRKTSPMPGHNPLAASEGRFRDQPFERLRLITDLQQAPGVDFSALRREVEAKIYFNDLPLDLRADVFEAGSIGRAILTLSVDARQLADKAIRSGLRSEIQMFAMIRDLSGRIVRELQETLLSDKPAPSNSPERLVHQRDVFLPPGRYKLEVFVKDVNAGRLGGVERLLFVPAVPDDNRLRVSSLLLAQRIEAAPDPGGPGAFRIWPASGSSVPLENRRLGFYFEIYGHRIDQSSGRPDLEIQYAVEGPGEEELQVIPQYHSADPSPNRISVLSVLSAEGWKPGRYRLKVLLRDGISHAEAERSVAFNMR